MATGKTLKRAGRGFKVELWNSCCKNFSINSFDDRCFFMFTDTSVNDRSLSAHPTLADATFDDSTFAKCIGDTQKALKSSRQC
jgi:hypothetical protein